MSKVIDCVADIELLISNYKANNKTIAFVPTMGGLHDGHLSLVDMAKENADIVVVSIFVNPTQFGKNEDFDKYPNTFESDKKLLNEKGVDIIFIPNKDEVYPQGTDSDIEPGSIANILCGASRPGHFKGVVQVVNRLFNIVAPDVAVFGEKDYQQLLIIKRMVKKLNKDTTILSAPIMRESSGLAMSTRNQYLTDKQKHTAAKLYQTLTNIKDRYLLTDINRLQEFAIKELSKDFKVDYFQLLDANNLNKITDNTSKIAILSAVYLGGVRLIDNLTFNKG